VFPGDAKDQEDRRTKNADREEIEDARAEKRNGNDDDPED
jgi:hypothetical protein